MDHEQIEKLEREWLRLREEADAMWRALHGKIRGLHPTTIDELDAYHETRDKQMSLVQKIMRLKRGE